jgi:hypothetical protein
MSNKDDDRRFEGAAYRGLSHGYRAPTEQEVQAGIAEALRGAVRDAGHNIHQPSSPAATPAAGTERVRGSGGDGTGWVEPRPLGLPSGIELVDRLCDQLLPHGSEFGKSKGEAKGK